ncbi:serine/arginine repetitive matrix protein 1-like [Lontra canadensis]|uniref:serine/arginine repetitive matrix protein 1-like n=2 Tax=Lontra canadensis TaxID=76717 RepID=UPI0013F39E38|nr:serine/arginine repetitive matrix protein 1-like [Lontra canadensis]
MAKINKSWVEARRLSSPSPSPVSSRAVLSPPPATPPRSLRAVVIAGLDVTARGWGEGVTPPPHPRPGVTQTPRRPPSCTSPAPQPREDGARLPESRARLARRRQLLRPGGGERALGGLERSGGGSPGLAARLQVSTGAWLCNRQRSGSRGRLGKQAEPINKATWARAGGPGQEQAALPATKGRSQRPGINTAAALAAQHSRPPRAPCDPPQRRALCEHRTRLRSPEPSTRFPAAAPSPAPAPGAPAWGDSSPRPSSRYGPSVRRVRRVVPGAMPFLGQDWRSPGQSWVKTADGWKRFLDEKSGSFVSDLSSYCNKEVYNKENLFNSLNYDVAAKKRKKDMLNSKTKTQYFHQEKWIYVHKGSTKERHGYCTLGEAFNRLDFSTAILDSRRFNYVVRVSL